MQLSYVVGVDGLTLSSKPSDVMRQETEGLWKSLQNSDAYFLVQQQALDDFSAKLEKTNMLAKLLASVVGIQDIVS